MSIKKEHRDWKTAVIRYISCRYNIPIMGGMTKRYGRSTWIWFDIFVYDDDDLDVYLPPILYDKQTRTVVKNYHHAYKLNSTNGEIRVGTTWLRQNLTDEQLANLITERMTTDFWSKKKIDQII